MLIYTVSVFDTDLFQYREAKRAFGKRGFIVGKMRRSLDCYIPQVTKEIVLTFTI